MYTVSPQIIVDKIEGKIVLFDPDRLLFHNLNETASLIFRLLQKNMDAEEIFREISDKYDAPPGQVKKDVLAILADLEKKGIIRKKEQ